MRLVNYAKWMSSRVSPKKQMRQAHAAFAFLLDYVPNWKKSYGKEGLIQYQSFIPKEHAEKVFRQQIELSQREGLVPLLAVFKRHRPDVVIASQANPVSGWLAAAKIRVPDEVGLVDLRCYDPQAGITGVHYDFSQTGAVGVEMLIGLLHRQERGVPARPQETTIPQRPGVVLVPGSAPSIPRPRELLLRQDARMTPS